MQQNEEKPVVFSALKVSNICGVVNQTAINWINSGYLKAFKTPGGQFRICPDDLAAFMKSRKMQIPEKLLSLCKSSEFASKILLIVDDDKGLNSVIAKFVEKKIPEIEIHQAFDGFEAGSLMTEFHPACMILDLNLPGINGFDLCKRIFESEKFGHPSIIVVTALEDAETEKKVKELGIASFLKKPIDLQNLAELVAKAFE